MNTSLDALAAILSSLTASRRASIHAVTESLVKLRLPRETIDTILAVVILESAEIQFVEDGGASPPERESTVDIFRSVFEKKKPKCN